MKVLEIKLTPTLPLQRAVQNLLVYFLHTYDRGLPKRWDAIWHPWLCSHPHALSQKTQSLDEDPGNTPV